MTVENLKKRVHLQPVVANMFLSEANLFYESGVISNISCQPVGKTSNHAVVIVGYSEVPDTDTTCTKGYWIVKSSFGTAWGV